MMLEMSKKQNVGNSMHSRLLAIMLLIGCVLFATLYSHNAYAAAPCTTDNLGIDIPEYTQTNTTLISDIITEIKGRLNNFTNSIFLSITGNFGFIVTIQAILTLYIVVYAISFMTGILPPIKLYDFLMRMFKIGVIVSLIGPGSWFYFNEYVVGFFDRGVEDIIKFVINNGMPLGSNISGAAPYTSSFTNISGAFTNIDEVAKIIFSPKTIVTIFALILDKPYGTFYALIILIALYNFIKSLMTALWVYVMSLVVRSILLGLAPIFIPTIMFQRTRHIFDGWLNQLVSVSLQPILLFIFFIFFVRLMQGSMDTIFSYPVCFSKYPDGIFGTHFDFSSWKFAVKDPTLGWVPNTKEWETDKSYPIDPMAIYTFLLITVIASSLNSIVVQVASRIAQTSTSLVGVEGPIAEMKNSFLMAQGSGKRKR
jgi:type IV secretory pathway VirB6-like protein